MITRKPTFSGCSNAGQYLSVSLLKSPSRESLPPETKEIREREKRRSTALLRLTLALTRGPVIIAIPEREEMGKT